MNGLASIIRFACGFAVCLVVGACQVNEPDPAVRGESEGSVGPPLQRLEAAALDAGMPPEEMEAILSIAREARPARRVFRAEMRDAQRELRAELARPSPSEEEVVRLVRAFSDAEAQMRVHSMRTLLHMYDAVSPEYRDVLGTMTPGHEDARWRGRRGGR